MKELKMDLLTSKYTKVLVEEDFQYNAPHDFRVVHEVGGSMPQAILADIHFQEGRLRSAV